MFGEPQRLQPLLADIDDYTTLIDEGIDALCRHSESTQVIVLAHSMGGLAARAYLRRHGQSRVFGLVCGYGEAAFGEGLTVIASLALAMTANTRDMPSGLTLAVIRTAANRSIHGQDSLSLGRPLFIAAAAL